MKREYFYAVLLIACQFLVTSCVAQEQTQAQKQAPAQAQGQVKNEAQQPMPENKKFSVDNFEGEISGGAQGTVDYGSGNGSSLEVSADTQQVHSGKQSLKAVFDAVSGGYMWIARGTGLDAANAGWILPTEGVDWQQVNVFSFFMYGSASGAKIAVDLKDSGNEMWRFTITDDTSGWKQFVCPLTSFAVRDDWQPQSADKNGAIDFPLKSYQFEPLPVSKGTFYFDDVELMTK